MPCRPSAKPTSKLLPPTSRMKEGNTVICQKDPPPSWWTRRVKVCFGVVVQRGLYSSPKHGRNPLTFGSTSMRIQLSGWNWFPGAAQLVSSNQPGRARCPCYRDTSPASRISRCGSMATPPQGPLVRLPLLRAIRRCQLMQGSCKNAIQNKPLGKKSDRSR